jgi:hypothetical protein
MQWGEQGANGHPRRRRDFPNIFNPNGNRIFFRFKNLLFNVPVFVRIFFFILFWALTEVRPNDPTPPSEENVTFLTSMGFSRDRVMRALQTTGNNVEAATNLLLQE